MVQKQAAAQTQADGCRLWTPLASCSPTVRTVTFGGGRGTTLLRKNLLALAGGPRRAWVFGGTRTWGSGPGVFDSGKGCHAEPELPGPSGSLDTGRPGWGCQCPCVRKATEALRFVQELRVQPQTLNSLASLIFPPKDPFTCCSTWGPPLGVQGSTPGTATHPDDPISGPLAPWGPRSGLPVRGKLPAGLAGGLGPQAGRRSPSSLGRSYSGEAGGAPQCPHAVLHRLPGLRPGDWACHPFQEPLRGSVPLHHLRDFVFHPVHPALLVAVRLLPKQAGECRPPCLGPHVQVTLHLRRVPGPAAQLGAPFKRGDDQDTPAEHEPRQEAARAGNWGALGEPQGEGSAGLWGRLGACGHQKLSGRGQ